MISFIKKKQKKEFLIFIFCYDLSQNHCDHFLQLLLPSSNNPSLHSPCLENGRHLRRLQLPGGGLRGGGPSQQRWRRVWVEFNLWRRRRKEMALLAGLWRGPTATSHPGGRCRGMRWQMRMRMCLLVSRFRNWKRGSGGLIVINRSDPPNSSLFYFYFVWKYSGAIDFVKSKRKRGVLKMCIIVTAF